MYYIRLPLPASHVRRFLITLVVATLVGGFLPSPAAATVSGRPGQIAFVSDRDGDKDIYVMNSDGSGVVNLTNDHSYGDLEPAWSPDGRRIAFRSERDSDWQIYLMDADGGNVVRLTDVGSNFEPSWSPDGRRIAYAGTDGLYVVNVDGSGRTRVTDPGADPREVATIRDGDPVWSPDGNRIAFVRSYLTGSPFFHDDLLMMIAVGSGSNPIALPSTGWYLFSPDWSPDGRRIVVVEGQKTSSVPPGLTTQAVLVDVEASTRTAIPGFAGLMQLSWSPDGSRFVGSNGEVHLVGLDGSDLGNLSNDAGEDSDPDWQALNPYQVGAVDPATGVWYLRHADASVTSFYFGNPGDSPFLGDWNGDGVETPGLYRPSDGFVYLRNSNTQGIADLTFFFGNPGDVPIVGDFDGDGFDTVSIYRPSEQRFYIINELGAAGAGLGAAEFSFLFGNPGDKPFVGDFDGDGIDEVGLHRESTGRVYMRNSLTTGVADLDFIYGNPGDRLVAFDWNRDGKESPAVFRPANSTFYFRFTNTQGTADAQFIWGSPHWIPVAGDFE